MRRSGIRAGRVICTLVVYTEATFSDFGLIRASFTILGSPSCFLRKNKQLWFGHMFLSFVFPHPPGSDSFGKHATKLHNSTIMSAIYVHTTYICTSSLHARYVYMLLRPIYFVKHV